MSNYMSVITIPAYDTADNGLIIELKLTIMPNRALFVSAIGSVAAALQKNLQRIIEIMSSLKKSWECLATTGYLLECANEQFIVRDIKSSSMALCIALINAQRAITGKLQVAGLSGTGMLRMDGSFEGVHLQEKKYLAAKENIKLLTKFITPADCRHIFDLDKLINQSH